MVFLPHCNKGAEDTYLLNREEIEEISGLLTGHFPLRYHLKHMRLFDEDQCIGSFAAVMPRNM